MTELVHSWIPFRWLSSANGQSEQSRLMERDSGSMVFFAASKVRATPGGRRKALAVNAKPADKKVGKSMTESDVQYDSRRRCGVWSDDGVCGRVEDTVEGRKRMEFKWGGVVTTVASALSQIGKR